MANKVADMLVVAHSELSRARAGNDKAKLEAAIELTIRAMMHPGADAFFSALDAAAAELADIEGNDPTIIENDMSPLNPLAPDPQFDDEPQDDSQEEETPDEDSDAASPADEALVNHDQASFAVSSKSSRTAAVLAAIASRLSK